MIPHPAFWISMLALALVVGYAVWLLVIARGDIDPYDRLAPLTHDPKDDDVVVHDIHGNEWRSPATPVEWPPKRRAG